MCSLEAQTALQTNPSQGDRVHHISGQDAFAGVVVIRLIGNAIRDWIIRKQAEIGIHELQGLAVVRERARGEKPEIEAVGGNGFEG